MSADMPEVVDAWVEPDVHGGVLFIVFAHGTEHWMNLFDGSVP